jgi:hypothetical protein
MIEAGLLVGGEDIAVPYDRFRDRVMFPIADWRGRVIAFGGRALEKEVAAKYLNSPETPLFHKGATLYNIAAARKAAHEGAQVIAVEGYIDAIAMVMAGFEATVAPLGTALTTEQLLLMWRIADEPTLCFDGDDAGRRAAYRAIDLALPLVTPGKSLKFATLPEGQDPDDLGAFRRRRSGRGRAGRGAAAGRNALGKRNRGRSLCHAGTARGARSAAARGDGERRRRNGAPLLPGGLVRAVAPFVCARRDSAAAQLAGPRPRRRRQASDFAGFLAR